MYRNLFIAWFCLCIPLVCLIAYLIALPYIGAEWSRTGKGLGCISKALAARYGEQSNRRSSMDLGTGWIDRVQNELHEKLNVFARHVRIKTGIELGIPSQRTDWYDVELDHYREFDRHRKQEIDKEIRELEESLK